MSTNSGPGADAKRRPVRRILAAAALALVVGAFAGCSTLAYYGQAVVGQARILCLKRPIEDWLADDRTPDELRERLRTVLDARTFAVDRLLLPDEGYRTYADLPREPDGTRPRAVVWNVFAAPELSLEPRRWCFPVAGCVVYRGYFSRRAAERFAAGLAGSGDDVAVRGAAAYSTLGWFSDPLLSTVIEDPPLEIVALLFHEMAHLVVYVPDDSDFNEAFATAVEQEGLRRWIDERRIADSEVVAHRERERRNEDFAELLLRTRAELLELYAGPAPRAEKLTRKSEILGRLAGDCTDRYDLPAGDPRCAFSNADLVAVATYHRLVPRFRALLTESGGDLPRFYQRVRELAASDEERAAFRDSETSLPTAPSETTA